MGNFIPKCTFFGEERIAITLEGFKRITNTLETKYSTIAQF